MSDTVNSSAGGQSADEDDSIIRLTDDEGNEQEFELLDLIEYGDAQYAVLIPTEEEEDQVLIFQVEDAEKETNVLTPVSDMDLAGAVFELFRTRNADRFDFD